MNSQEPIAHQASASDVVHLLVSLTVMSFCMIRYRSTSGEHSSQRIGRGLSGGAREVQVLRF